MSVPSEPAPDQPAGLNIDKAALVAAVERYLAQRGVNVSGATLSAAVAAALPAQASMVAPAPKPPLHGAVAGAVDRFLAAKQAHSPAAVQPPAAPSCGCSIKPAESTSAVPAAPEAPAQIPAPKIEIVPFVCEADVREAIAKKKKIFIGPKTIVTPSARDLAGPDEILVRAER